MSEQAIRQKIFDTLFAVPDIGKVYDYERWNVDWGKFIALFQDPASKRILGWEISRPTFTSQRIDALTCEVGHGYRITGYMGVEDAAGTEKLFEAKIEAICQAFKLDITLGGACLFTGAMAKQTGDTRLFGSVLCHYAELVMTATEHQ
jgi:hypothetical protein